MGISKQYSNLLPRHLCGLGVICDHALAAQDLSTILNIAGQDIVDFFTKSAYLTSLRMEWEIAIKKHMSLMKKAEKHLIFKVKQVFTEISNRVLKSSLAENSGVKRHLKFIDDVLAFKYCCGSTPFYVVALGMINGLCNELMAQKQMDILEGIAQFSSSSPYAKNSALMAFACEKERENFAELHASFKQNKCPAWQPWFFLHVLRDCLKQSKEKFSTLHSTVSSEKEALKNSSQLRRFLLWKELKLIQEGIKDPQFFTRSRFSDSIESMIRQIFVQEAGAKQKTDEKIHSIALELHSEEFRFVVNRNDSPSSDIYILKEFDPGSDPIMFIKAILKRPGEKIDLKSIPCFQSISKLIQRTNLKGILAEIFVPYRKNGVVMLYASEILFSELKEKEKLMIYELLPNLKPYSF